MYCISEKLKNITKIVKTMLFSLFFKNTEMNLVDIYLNFTSPREVIVVNSNLWSSEKKTCVLL